MNISTIGLKGSSAIRLLLDTQILIWFQTADRRLKPEISDAMIDPVTELFISAVVAWEYSDLRYRKKVAAPETIDDLQDGLGFELLDLPSAIWSDVEQLPPIHRDPMDRMLISHARLVDMTLVTADKNIHQYPVKTLW